MRRLTLILSDLYLPEETEGETAAGPSPALPGLEWLLHFGDAQPIDDWRRWLTRELGVPELGELPVAEVAARAWLPPGTDGSPWLATPLELSARIDHVRLPERGLLRVDPQEAERWSAAFAGQFAPRLRLHPAGERAFVLTGMNAAPATTVDPARLLGSDIREALPHGAGASDLRRLGAEIEMWLHQLPLNESRTAAGKPRLSGLWIWGGGGQPSSASLPRIPPHTGAMRIHGADAFLAGLAVSLGSEMPQVPPDDFSRLESAIDHHVVEFAAMTGASRESLAMLDSGWFAAARHALASGDLSELVLVANDRCFRLGRRSHWRLWRRRRGWLENLARRTETPKA